MKSSGIRRMVSSVSISAAINGSSSSEPTLGVGSNELEIGEEFPTRRIAGGSMESGDERTPGEMACRCGGVMIALRTERVGVLGGEP